MTAADPEKQPVNNGNQPVNFLHHQTYELVDLNQVNPESEQISLMTSEEALRLNERLIEAGSDKQWRTVRAPRMRTSEK